MMARIGGFGSSSEEKRLKRAECQAEHQKTQEEESRNRLTRERIREREAVGSSLEEDERRRAGVEARKEEAKRQFQSAPVDKGSTIATFF